AAARVAFVAFVAASLSAPPSASSRRDTSAFGKRANRDVQFFSLPSTREQREKPWSRRIVS
ncbi:hypothetical protein NBG98_25340, partial [Burkholderia cenocepacia]